MALAGCRARLTCTLSPSLHLFAMDETYGTCGRTDTWLTFRRGDSRHRCV